MAKSATQLDCALTRKVAGSNTGILQFRLLSSLPNSWDGALKSWTKKYDFAIGFLQITDQENSSFSKFYNFNYDVADAN